MNFSFRSALALVLGTALAGSLSSCDYSWSPGKDPQSTYNFNNPPGWRSYDVDRDSINYKQVTPPPGGIGSAAAIEQGTVLEQQNSAPGGRSGGSPQSASGMLGPIDQSVNGNGNQLDKEQPKSQPQ